MSITTLQREAILSPESVVKVYQTLESIELIRPAWDRLQQHPNADFDFYTTILRTRRTIVRPHVVTVEEGGEVMAMLIGRIEEATVKFRLGYLDLLRPRVRSLTIVYGGVLGDLSERYAELLVDSLQEALRRGEADVVTFSKISVESALYKVALRRPGGLRRDLAPASASHWAIELPSSFEGILKRLSPKRRNEFKRKARRFHGAFPDQVRYHFYTAPGDCPRLCAEVEEVARLTYQRGLRAGFVDDEEHRARLALAAARGELLACLVYLNERPCAFGIGVIHRNVFHWEFTGYDPSLRRYQIGTLVLAKILDHLCQKGIRRFDFGLGDADYKRDLATVGWQESTVHLFAPRLRPIAINLVRGLLETSVKWVRAAQKRLGLDQALKRRWRRRLAQPGAGDAPEKSARDR